MLPCANLEQALLKLNVKTVKAKGVEYLNIPCGFDIETTSMQVGDAKVAHMYIWMIGIGHNNGVYYGRTWEEFVETCELISDTFGLNERRRIVVYVHNLSYEFQFMRKYLEWEESPFSIDERKPIKALSTLGIEFRDSYILSGFSLALTAKNLVKHTVKKMTGDLDYSKPRHHKTTLTAAEMGYCENDIEIITAYIDEQMTQYGDITKIPVTNTGRVRERMKERCLYGNNKNRNKGQYQKYRKIMNDLTMTPEVYKQARGTFMGGFTHANARHVGKVLKNVSSVDFTSSYPSVMLSEKFPMTRFRPVTINTQDELERYCDKFAVMMDVTLHFVEPRIQHENYLSASKCFNAVGVIENNGRVEMAEKITVSVTEVDFAILRKAYKWEEMSVSNAYIANKAYLPKPIIETVLEMYQKKTTLKDVAGMEAEYLNEKGMLNSTYGMCVTDPVKDDSLYEGDMWLTEKADLNESIEKYNQSKNRVLYYPWGLWVTAYARRNLWTGIFEMGDDYVYSDTDSLKILNYEAHKDYFKRFDAEIVAKMEAMCDFYGLDKTLLAPKTIKGVTKMIGVWDYEGTYELFKTLGAKRYLQCEKGKLKLTVAGLSKQNGINYMLDKSGGDVNKVFAMFDDALYIPAENTGKMTHTYQDACLKYQCTDLNGVTETVEPASGIHLEPCEFTMTISDGFKTHLARIAAGQILKREVKI